MDVATLITVLAQLGLAGAAWRLASELKATVSDHEDRISDLEEAK